MSKEAAVRQRQHCIRSWPRPKCTAHAASPKSASPTLNAAVIAGGELSKFGPSLPPISTHEDLIGASGVELPCGEVLYDEAAHLALQDQARCSLPPGLLKLKRHRTRSGDFGRDPSQEDGEQHHLSTTKTKRRPSLPVR